MSGQARHPSRATARLVIAAAAVAAMVVGGTGGLVLGTELVLGDPDPRRLPDLPANFPDPSVQYLPGLTVSVVTSRLADLGLECERLTWPGVPDRQECGASHLFYAKIEYDSESQIRAFTTRCYRGAEDPTGLCRDPFRQSVDIVFDGQPPGARDQAREWVEQYADDEAIIENEAEVVTRAGEIALTVSGLGFDDDDDDDALHKLVDLDALYELDLRRA